MAAPFAAEMILRPFFLSFIVPQKNGKRNPFREESAFFTGGKSWAGARGGEKEKHCHAVLFSIGSQISF
jgi:hypothetical protein